MIHAQDMIGAVRVINSALVLIPDYLDLHLDLPDTKVMSCAELIIENFRLRMTLEVAELEWMICMFSLLVLGFMPQSVSTAKELKKMMYDRNDLLDSIYSHEIVAPIMSLRVASVHKVADPQDVVLEEVVQKALEDLQVAEKRG